MSNYGFFFEIDLRDYNSIRQEWLVKSIVEYKEYMEYKTVKTGKKNNSTLYPYKLLVWSI